VRKAISTLARAFFQEYGVARHHIDSFNIFLNEGMQRVVDEVHAMNPLIFPPGYESYKLLFGKLRILHPVVREADGSSSLLYPMEARIRNLTYSAPIQLEVIPEKDGAKGEPVWADIGEIPIMVRSDKCLLHGLSNEELMEVGEDPYDPGGYFIISGTERVLMSIEDLVPNIPLLETPRSGTAEEVARLFSEVPGFRIPHLFQRRKDGVIYVSWARVPKVPLTIVLKALGLETDQAIVSMISDNPDFVEDIMANIEMLEEIETQQDALEYIGKKLKIGQGTQYRVERSAYLMDNYLLPHIGTGKKFRNDKALFVGSVAERLMDFHYGNLPEDDKDHYGNKRLKLAGELMEQLFRAAFKTLANDMKYSFERIVKRGREPSAVTIIRSQLLTSRIQSAMATGYWIGGRSGVAQHLQRLNFFDTMSHLRRVMSPLASGQPHFEARELHPTHWGKLCVAETPEGSNIGLRKNFALFSKLSYNTSEEDVSKLLDKVMEDVGVGRRNA
jgi:DNA-directed RNA polymerase beta subunit